MISKWTRAERLAFYSLLVAIIGVLVALFIPELRARMGLAYERASGGPNSSSINSSAGNAVVDSVRPTFRFSVSNIPEHFPSTLDLLGAYEIAIPADSKWHDTNITIYPNNQLQIGFMRGTAGNVAIRVGDVSDAFNQSQPDGVWYEYNLVRQLRGNRFDRVFNTADTLKVRSGENDVFIRVEVRQW